MSKKSQLAYHGPETFLSEWLDGHNLKVMPKLHIWLQSICMYLFLSWKTIFPVMFKVTFHTTTTLVSYVILVNPCKSFNNKRIQDNSKTYTCHGSKFSFSLEERYYFIFSTSLFTTK